MAARLIEIVRELMTEDPDMPLKDGAYDWTADNLYDRLLAVEGEDPDADAREYTLQPYGERLGIFRLDADGRMADHDTPDFIVSRRSEARS